MTREEARLILRDGGLDTLIESAHDVLGGYDEYLDDLIRAYGNLRKELKKTARAPKRGNPTKKV